jgi:hypothetical protein
MAPATAAMPKAGGHFFDGILPHPGPARQLLRPWGRQRRAAARHVGERLGIEAAVDELVDLGDRPGAHRPGRKVLTLLHALVIGGDCIDDADVLRTGFTAAVLGHRVMAPSTLGTFLRSFTFGHIRQLDRVAETIRGRAWAAGAGPGDGPMTIDLYSTVCEVHGHHKGGAAYGYTRVLGYHPGHPGLHRRGAARPPAHRPGGFWSWRGAVRQRDRRAHPARRGQWAAAAMCGSLPSRWGALGLRG